MKGIFSAESWDIQKKCFFLRCWVEDASQASDFPTLPTERESLSAPGLSDAAVYKYDTAVNASVSHQVPDNKVAQPFF